MHMPRTFYEDFQARWPEVFKVVGKFVATLPPVEPGSSVDDNRPLRKPDSLTPEMRHALWKVQTREMGRLLATNPADPQFEADAREFADICETMDALILFQRYGKRTFYVQPNLVQRLAHTTLDVDCSDIRLPFPYLMLVFDDPITREAAQRFWPTTGPLSVFLYETISLDGRTKGKRVLRTMPMIAKQFASTRVIFDTALDGHVSSTMLHTPTDQLLQIVLNTLDYIEEPWDEVAPVTVKTPSNALSKKVSKLPYIDLGRKY